MGRSSVKVKPYSIRCGKAIEQLVGGRQSLAKALNVSEQAVARWFHEESIPARQVIALVRLSNGKFAAEELLGEHD